MISLNRDFRDLLNCLNSAGVRYMVIGGYAVNFHGYHRNTKDIDIWIALERDNAARVSRALKDFGFAPATVPASKFLDRKAVHAFGREPFRVDLLTAPDGIEFEACYPRRVEVMLDGIKVPFIGLQDLRENKQATGRLRDLADVENLPRKPTSSRGKRKRTR
jgi:predicted nucleotidyltransferase